MNFNPLALFDVVGNAVDLVGKAIGLPEPLVAAAKVGIGIATQNWMMVVNGGVQLASELAKNPPFKTEYHSASPQPWDTQGSTSREPWATQSCGYAPGGPTKPGTPSKPGTSNQPPVSNPLPGDYGTYYQHLRTLQANHSLFDGLYKADGAIDRAELQRMAGNPKADPKLRSAAQFLLDNPHYLQRLDRRGFVGFSGSDKGITRLDLSLELAKVKADIEKYGLPVQPRAGDLKRPPPPCFPGKTTPVPRTPVPHTPAPQTPCPPPGRPTGSPPIAPGGCIPGGGTDSVINDPTLSVEQKVMLILQRIVEGTDDEMLEVMKQIEDVSNRNADILAKGDKASSQEQANVKKSETTLQMLQQRLQELMERKKRMTELMSNLSMKFHEMARTAISNLGRA